ncbi:MAG: hypothetical protein WAM28_01570 [Chlamydiales bacterium]
MGSKDMTTGVCGFQCCRNTFSMGEVKKRMVTVDFVSKISKLGQEVCTIVGEQAASEDTRAIALSMRYDFKVANTVFALPKVFQGVTKAAYEDAEATSNALGAILDGPENTNSWLKLGRHSTGFVAKVSVIAGFGVARWITFIEKHWGEFGKDIHAIGQSFWSLMFVSHSFGTFSGGCGIMEEMSNAARDDDQRMDEGQRTRFHNLVLGFFEDLLDLFSDLMKVFAFVAPPVVRYSLGLTNALIGTVKSWNKVT